MLLAEKLLPSLVEKLEPVGSVTKPEQGSRNQWVVGDKM